MEPQETTPAMPIYEYACRTCDHRFETLVRGHEAPSCPRCHGEDLERALSSFAVGGPAARSEAPMAPCGRCGDPRGPGACAVN
jgi:putative FmdB family regulatory protein